jgi:hypothetical protein
MTHPLISLCFFALLALLPAAEKCYLYPLDAVPHDDSLAAIVQREQILEKKWHGYLAGVAVAVKAPGQKPWKDLIQRTSSRDLLTLATDYGFPTLKKEAVAKAEKEYTRRIVGAQKVLEKNGIRDIGDVADLNVAMREALVLKEAGAFSAELSASLEALLTRFVEGKSCFWGFTPKFPYFLSGYNKECITMEVGSNTKLLYQATGKFPNTIDAFDAAWAQLTQQGYELDNAPHYDSSVNLLIVLRWGMLHGKLEEIQRAPHFRMIFDRMARMALVNGEHANFGKSMAVGGKSLRDGQSVDWLFVNGGGLGTMMRWAYRFYRDPGYLYLARKYEMTNGRGKGALTFMPKAHDLNFFEVKNARPSSNMPLCDTTIRLKGPGYALDRGVRRAQIQLVPDKLVLATGTHPQAASLLMDVSFTQSKAMTLRRCGIDNHLYQGTHTVSIVGRQPEADRTNRVVVKHPTLKDPNRPKYELRDYVAKRVNKDLAYGELEYSTFQVDGIESKRRMALLHNGVLVVEDYLRASAPLQGDASLTLLYNVWHDTVARGPNWVLSTPHVGHLPDGSATPVTQVFAYVAPMPGMTSKVDDQRTFDRLQQLATLRAGGEVRMISCVIPLPSTHAATIAPMLAEAIKTTIDPSGSTVSIPYAEGTQMVVHFPRAAGTLASFALRGSTTHASLPIPSRQAKVNPPYAKILRRKNEWSVADFKADFSLHETRIRAVTCRGVDLRRDRDYVRQGPMLRLTKERIDQWTKENFSGVMQVHFDEGQPISLRLVADSTTGLVLSNARRKKLYQNDEMFLAHGFRENGKATAVGSDMEMIAYDDWLYRGEPKKYLIRKGQTISLPKPYIRSFRLRESPAR